MRPMKKTLLSTAVLCLALLGSTASAAATATVSFSASPSSCSGFGSFTSVTASGNQLIFPVKGTYSQYGGPPYISCTGNYIVTLSGATVASVQGPSCPPSMTCTYSALNRVTASGNQITFPITGYASVYPGGSQTSFATSYVVTLSGAAATAYQGPVSPSGVPCAFDPFKRVTASGSQITFPLTTSQYFPGGPNYSCTSSYVVTLY